LRTMLSFKALTSHVCGEEDFADLPAGESKRPAG
jgi:hypothetical protein